METFRDSGGEQETYDLLDFVSQGGNREEVRQLVDLVVDRFPKSDHLDKVLLMSQSTLQDHPTFDEFLSLAILSEFLQHAGDLAITIEMRSPEYRWEHQERVLKSDSAGAWHYDILGDTDRSTLVEGFFVFGRDGVDVVHPTIVGVGGKANRATNSFMAMHTHVAGLSGPGGDFGRMVVTGLAFAPDTEVSEFDDTDGSLPGLAFMPWGPDNAVEVTPAEYACVLVAFPNVSLVISEQN